MSTELAIKNLGVDLDELMGVPQAKTSAFKQMPYLEVMNKPLVVSKVDEDGDTVQKTIIKPGGFELYQGYGENKKSVYAKSVKFRCFIVRQYWATFSQAAGRSIRSVYAANLSGDLPDQAGTFNCGRPARIEDYANAPDYMKAIKPWTSYFGLVTIEDPIGPDGKPVEGGSNYIEVPCELRSKNAPSKKALNAVLQTLKKDGLRPWNAELNLSGTEKKNGEIQWGEMVISRGGQVELSEADVAQLKDFQEAMEGTNVWIMDTYHGKSNKDMSAEDRAQVEEFIDIDA